MIPDAQALATMPGSELLAEVRDALLEEAARIRGLEEIARPSAWNEGRAQAHHAICAAAEIVWALRGMGEEAKAKGAKPSWIVLRLADIARTALIRERARQNQPSAAAEEAGDADVA